MSDKTHDDPKALKAKVPADDHKPGDGPMPGDDPKSLHNEARVAKGMPKIVIPPREPEGPTAWRVTVRHSPLKTKSLVVQASSKREAWAMFLEAATAKATDKSFAKEPGRHQLAHEMLAEARKLVPEGTEILSDEYAQKRLEALLVKGTVTVDQIGFEELASAGPRSPVTSREPAKHGDTEFERRTR